MDNAITSKKTILAVDDTPANIDIVKGVLAEDYVIQAAVNGNMALKIIGKKKPDLILLDIMMPGMDGYEVCRHIKENKTTSDIPIIFLTAKAEEEDETKGLSLGAVDYITKPISPSILHARVETHLQLKEAMDALKKQNHLLMENAKLHEDIERITRHDLKAPLAAFIGFPQIFGRDNLTERQQEYLDIMNEAGQKLLNMINLTLDLYKMEQGSYQVNSTPVNIIEVIREVIHDCSDQLRSLCLRLEIKVNGEVARPEDHFIVAGEKLLFYSMLANILKNAIEASQKGQLITVTLSESVNKTIAIHNEAAVPNEIRETFFKKYVTSGKSYGTGLGTYSARLIAKTLKGEVKLDTSEEKGTSVIFEFPQ